MPWDNDYDRFTYTTGLLKGIAMGYASIYMGLELGTGYHVSNPWAIAEFKADFDTALRGIGKGKWPGLIALRPFGYYRRYGRLQQIIIADILGVGDYDLWSNSGFYRIPQLRGYAYYLMARVLNEGG